MPERKLSTEERDASSDERAVSPLGKAVVVAAAESVI
jgi:hypothetical protein